MVMLYKTLERFFCARNTRTFCVDFTMGMLKLWLRSSVPSLSCCLLLTTLSHNVNTFIFNVAFTKVPCILGS